ncbi:MAG: GTPase [Candidatus Micrarchaeia archaeon]
MEGKRDLLEQKLDELKGEYSKTRYNKATNKHLGILRRKIAEVKKEMLETGTGRAGSGFFVRKSGDATVALVGFPSTGKSTMINALTGTRSKTAAHAFTTLEILPGTLVYKGAHVQVFDMPGIIEGAHIGVGGGRSVIAALRNVDLIVFVIDATDYGKLGVLIDELKRLNIFVNRAMPEIRIEKASTGIGIVIDKNASYMSENDVKAILRGFGIYSAHVQIGSDIDVDELIALVSGRARYLKAIAALNKIDMVDDYMAITEKISRTYGMYVVPVSAMNGTNIEELKEAIYTGVELITVYLKPKGGTAEPLILHAGATIGDAAAKVHTELKNQLKCAYVSGPSAKFSGQKVGAGHLLKNGDMITFMK